MTLTDEDNKENSVPLAAEPGSNSTEVEASENTVPTTPLTKNARARVLAYVNSKPIQRMVLEAIRQMG